MVGPFATRSKFKGDPSRLERSQVGKHLLCEANSGCLIVSIIKNNGADRAYTPPASESQQPWEQGPNGRKTFAPSNLRCFLPFGAGER
jgi:hypothetical protein